MGQTSSVNPKFALRGVSTGVLFMAVFSTLWASIGSGGLQGWGGIWPHIIVVLIGIVLLVGFILLIRAGRRLPDQGAAIEPQRGRQVGKWFNIVFAGEGVLIALTSVICIALRRFELILPITAIIVGAHFFPLAWLFDVKAYHLVGAVLCVLGILALFVIPAQIQIAGHQINGQQVVLGFGSALVLWAVGFGLWLLAGKMLAETASSQVREDQTISV